MNVFESQIGLWNHAKAFHLVKRFFQIKHQQVADVPKQ